MKPSAEKVDHLEIYEVTRMGRKYIQFDFTGYLDYPTAEAGIETWRRLMTGTDKHHLIYHCTDMTGFDSSAREIWQAALKEMKADIANIWMVSDNRFILAAAKTMGILAGFPIKTTRSLDAIP
jgi:hypothetical protein